MDGYEQELHIDDELFAGLREDADRVLQKLLKNMVEKGSLEGKVSIGIDVTFVQEFIPNRDPRIEGETRKVLTPKFVHKVGSVMQIKDEAKGDRNCDGNELVWDDEKGEYVLRPIANTDQMTIFDADFRCVNDPGGDGRPESDAGKEDEYLALEGGGIAALPGPADENPEQDDMSGAFEDDGYSYEEPDDYEDDE